MNPREATFARSDTPMRPAAKTCQSIADPPMRNCYFRSDIHSCRFCDENLRELIA